MKLAKKMLACVIALAMVAALAITAFAADTKLTVSSEKDGKMVIVTVSATEYAGFQSGSLTLKYDPEVLKYVDNDTYYPEGLDNGVLVEAGIPADKTADDGVLAIGLMYSRGAKNAEADIFKIYFEAVKDTNTTITVTANEWEGTGKPADATGNVVLAAPTTAAPTTAAPTTAAPTTAAPATEDASAPETTTKTPVTTPGMGDAGVAAVAGVMALAAVAFVVTRKKDAE